MLAGGIALVAHIRTVGGSEIVPLHDPQDVVAFLADADEFGAAFYGVTKSQYLEYRNYLSGFSQLPINEWLKRDGGYCAVHGGDGSEEARARGFG